MGRKIAAAIAIATCLIALAQAGAQNEQNRRPANSQQQQQQLERQRIFAEHLKELKAKDKCGAIFTSVSRGYQVKEFKVLTKDGYELQLHRLVHPSDLATDGPRAGAKKPYLLFHGLLGTSASYVNNVAPGYVAPRQVYNATPAIDYVLSSKMGDYHHLWQSTADRLGLTHGPEAVSGWTKGNKATFATVNEIDFDGDTLSFGKEYKQAHRKFDLPKEARGHIANSLAFTLSNFGYDVWMVNLRGNDYSKKTNTRYSSLHDEYWDFDIDKLIKQDLLASVDYVEKKSAWNGPIGIVTYSYTSMHILGLLTKFPPYLDRLQPVIMMAPSLMTGSSENRLLKYTIKYLSDILISSNGPFPALGRSKRDRIETLVCKMPIVSRLCRLFETLLHGRVKNEISVGSFIFSDRQTKLIEQDISCGQTSKAVLHQLINNFSKANVDPNFAPTVGARNRQMKNDPVRRSVILVHSQADGISAPSDVMKIRDSALRQMALVDYVIKEPEFGHTDFLFSQKNEYLVNGEIARMATLFDFMITRPAANRFVWAVRGY